MVLRLSIRVEGLAQLQRKLRADVLLAPIHRDALNATVTDARGLVEARAPRGRTGDLAASITSKLDARPVPTWGRISVTARRKSKKFPRGYRYPRWLEFAPKSPRQGWFLGSVVPAKSILARHLQAAKQRIERIWRQ